MADDGYVSWYQAKLWNLVPAIYRAQDATVSGAPGPLQELLNRIGAQTATLRRGIDRLYENQSIETCDDWVIPYIGDLLATRLVSCLDARAQRLDVANTIYYRRRAGTLGLLEELVSDIAGRDARAVEFFRRLGRTRHQFDPPIGNVFLPNAPLWAAGTVYAAGAIVANGVNAYICTAGGKSGTTGPAGGGEKITDGGVTWSFYNPLGALVPAVILGLAGANSRTPAGGFADLRNAYAAANTGTAFDEFSHTADLRAGTDSFGWYNISHLGMFIWWLHSYPIQNATPVSNGAANPCFTFDPSGRQIPLFAKESRTAASFGDDWVSPNEWQLPVRISEPLWSAYPDQFFGPAFAVLASDGTAIPRADLTIHPDSGLFSFIGGPPEGGLITQYCFGLMSTLGAGGFSPSLLETISLPSAVTKLTGGAALPALTASVTIEIGDSLTYGNFSAALDIGANTAAIIAAGNTRPMLRWPGSETWTINGNGGTLILQGLWLQGADIILTGSFDSVVLRFVTLDPGTEDGIAIDNMPLLPVHLTIEASITTLTLTNCITGPIRTQNSGAIEQLTATDSIIQAINAGDYALQTTTGDISLARCTILGPSAIHKLDASECILDDVTIAEDAQHGCIRFSAIAAGSIVHAPYLSVSIPPAGPIFFSRRFGDPDYARLLRLADNAIINPQTGDTILGGAQNGSEMGAFQSEGIALKRRGLAAKFEEFAPLGVFPVWIDAD
jgi:hypothetical protein